MANKLLLFLASKDNTPLVMKAFGHVRVEYTQRRYGYWYIWTYSLYHKGILVCDYIEGNTQIGAVMVRRTHRRMSPQDNIIIGAFIRCLNAGSFFMQDGDKYSPYSPAHNVYPLPNPILVKTTQLWAAKPDIQCVLALVQSEEFKDTIVGVSRPLIVSKTKKNQKARRGSSEKNRSLARSLAIDIHTYS